MTIYIVVPVAHMLHINVFVHSVSIIIRVTVNSRGGMYLSLISILAIIGALHWDHWLSHYIIDIDIVDILFLLS